MYVCVYDGMSTLSSRGVFIAFHSAAVSEGEHFRPALQLQRTTGQQATILILHTNIHTYIQNIIFMIRILLMHTFNLDTYIITITYYIQQTHEIRTFSAFKPLMKGDCSVPAVKMTRSDWYAYSAPLSSISVMCCAETFFTDVCSVILIPMAFSDLHNYEVET